MCERGNTERERCAPANRGTRRGSPGRRRRAGWQAPVTGRLTRLTVCALRHRVVTRFPSVPPVRGAYSTTGAPGHSEVTPRVPGRRRSPGVRDPRVQVKRVRSGPARWGVLGRVPPSPRAGPPGGALSDTQLTPPLGTEGEDPEDRDAGRGRNLEGAGERRAAGRRGPPALSGWALAVTRTTSGSSTLGPARGMPDHAARWQGCAVRLSRAVMALVSVRPARPSRPWGGRAVSLRLAALSAEGIQQCVASKPFSFASHSVKTRSICEAPM